MSREGKFTVTAPLAGERGNAWYDRAASADSIQQPLGPMGLAAELSGYSTPESSTAAKEFMAARGLDTGPLVRMGARVRGPAIAYPFVAGVKYRRMDTGRRWMRGRFRDHPLNVYYGTEPYQQVFVAESETDTAALLAAYPTCDVALMPLGAATWAPIWTAQLAIYPAVYIALDNDDAGELGAELIAAALPQAVRHAATGEVKDWSAWIAANGVGAAPILPSAYNPVADGRKKLVPSVPHAAARLVPGLRKQPRYTLAAGRRGGLRPTISPERP